MVHVKPIYEYIMNTSNCNYYNMYMTVNAIAVTFDIMHQHRDTELAVVTVYQTKSTVEITYFN